jgi:hypothetical protein
VILAIVQGNSRGSYVLLDFELPHWAVHYGRKAVRQVAAEANAAHNAGRSWGWYRPDGWGGMQVAVREHGGGRIVAWPITRAETPREWGERDALWRAVLVEHFKPVLSRVCDCTVEFAPGGGPIARMETDAQLCSVPIFVAGKPRFRRRAETRRLLVA